MLVGRRRRQAARHEAWMCHTCGVVASTDIDSISLEVRAAGFGALADPIRLDILARLADGAERCVCELLEDSGVAANLLSYHLAVLRRAGLIAAKRRGRWVDYRLVPGALRSLASAIPRPPEAPGHAGRRRDAVLPAATGRDLGRPSPGSGCDR